MGKLVAYSGFSSTNYLEMPYNPDLDFGTGDFCVMGWVKQPITSVDYLVSREAATGNGFFIRSSGTNFQGNVTGTTLSGPGAGEGVWHFVVLSRKSGVLSFYVDAELADSSADITDVNNASATTVIGCRYDNSGPLVGGSLALLRISATAPTAEQIKKIYEDEKVLFQENAQATLYGTSDAVTALAHDPVTGLLHVGTSDGRSVFQGLRRVENTTDAVSTAISASNDLIVEQ